MDKWTDWLRGRVRARRTREGLTQDETAEILGVSRTMLAHFEQPGGRLPRTESLDRIVSWVAEDLPPEADVVTLVTCPDCGQDTPRMVNGVEMAYCGRCGEALGLRCACGNIAPFVSRFCNACGKPLTGPGDNGKGGSPEDRITRRGK